MDEFVNAFFNELSREFWYGDFRFSYLDVFYAVLILSVVGEFIYHFIKSWTSRNV